MEFRIKLFILPLILSLSTFYSQTTEHTPSIEVYGNASVKVIPDIINFSLSVTTGNNIILAAKNENDRAVSKVLDVLKDRGIPDKDIQTSGIRINKNYWSSENDKNKEYTASNYITFVLKDVAKYYDITTELIKIEHVYITYSNYDYSNIIETRKHAREQALVAAKSKAEEMALVLDQAIGKPLLISEEPVYDYYPTQFNSVTQQGTQNYSSNSYMLQEGMLNVDAKVKVVFELITK